MYNGIVLCLYKTIKIKQHWRFDCFVYQSISHMQFQNQYVHCTRIRRCDLVKFGNMYILNIVGIYIYVGYTIIELYI